jgi:hypothetical protein
MDAVSIILYLKKWIKEVEADGTEVLSSGGVKNMEHYKEIIGYLTALNRMEQELTRLLKQKQEPEDD